MSTILPASFVPNSVARSADVNSNFTAIANEINRRGAMTTYTPIASATVTMDLSAALNHFITMPAGNITLAVSNTIVGDRFIVEITQDGGGSRTVTWFGTIRWTSNNTVPTLSTVGSRRDTFGFVVTGAGTYDGYIVGQNL